MGQQEKHRSGPSVVTELRGPVSFETRGVGRIPESERRSTPWTYFVRTTYRTSVDAHAQVSRIH
jgi:hypothetical protein